MRCSVLVRANHGRRRFLPSSVRSVDEIAEEYALDEPSLRRIEKALVKTGSYTSRRGFKLEIMANRI